MMKQEFYFVRHGQTDYNISKHTLLKEHPKEISINSTGKIQAANIEPYISQLSIKSICSSPLKRVQETREIISINLQAPNTIIEDFKECPAGIWKTILKLGTVYPWPNEGPLYEFLQRIEKGLKTTLSHPGPQLIVAHGGTHWAICRLLNIENHSWSLDNCNLVHFTMEPTSNKWQAKKLG